MRKFNFIAVIGLALVVGLGSLAAPAQPVGPPNEIWCNKTAVFSGGPSTASLIAGVTGRTINICGFIVTATAASTVSFAHGGGATCGTNTIQITLAHNLLAGGVLSYTSGSAWYSTTAGNSLCITSGGTGPVQVTLMYSSF